MGAPIASFGILAVVLPLAPLSLAQADPCESGSQLLRAGLVEDAVDQFTAAADAGLVCGGGPDATAALDAKQEAQARYMEGQAAEARGDRAGAVERYTAALDVNRQHAGALDALRRLSGVSTTSTTSDPFAAAESLAGLGREDEATEAAVKTITDTGATPEPGSAVYDLVDRNRWERTSEWVADRWAWFAVGIAGALLVWSRFKTTPWVRRGSASPVVRRLPPRLRLAVEAEDQTGSEKDLGGAFAVRLREDLASQEVRASGDPRFVVGSDAVFELPDLTQAPAQVTWLTTVWRWLMKQNIIVLHVTLLPTTPAGIGCHAVLLESNRRSLVRPGPGAGALENLRLHIERRPDDTWKYDPETAVPPYQWLYLVPLLSAWALYATRKVQATAGQLARDLGTTNGEAYGEFLSGLQRASEPARALPFFQRATSLDPNFLEAHLNRANCEASVGAYDDGQAHLERVLTGATEENPRHRALRLRARYALIVLRLNRLTTSLTGGDLSQISQKRDEALAVVETAGALSTEIEEITRRPDDALSGLAFAVRDHVRLMRAGAIDLAVKYEQYVTVQPRSFPSLPLDLDPKDDLAARREALTIMAAYPIHLASAAANYSLACIWARDWRMGGDQLQKDQVLKKVKDHLRRAAGDDPRFGTYWRDDPDFADLRLSNNIDDADITPSIAAPRA